MKTRQLLAAARTPLALALIASLSFGLIGCGGEASKAPSASQADIKVNTPKDIAQESADNYDDNRNGLITGTTLKGWISDWETNRPAGIKGKLVILQQVRGPAGYEFIKPNNTNVFTYLESGWRENRDNGVLANTNLVIDGPSTDAIIRKYGIDVKNDLIVCAQGTGGSAAMNMGRCWYTFRYFGVEAKNLAVLNGGNNHLGDAWTSDDFTAKAVNAALAHPSPIINKQVSSVKDLGVDNTALQATLQDVIEVLPYHDENNLKDGYFFWDARSLDQFSAGEASEAGGALVNRYSSFQNGGTRQGHPRGALQLQWTNTIDSATGKFKSKAELAAYLNGEIDAKGKGFVDGTYQNLGAGNGYQPGDLVVMWCETSARAAVTQIVTAVILGLPTRMYDAAMIEWNSLTAGAVDSAGNVVLPTNSPWDTSALSAPYFPNLSENVQPRDGSTGAQVEITNAYGANTQAIINEDKAYIRPAAASTGGNGGNGGATSSAGGNGGGNVIQPPNPCGG